jgi:hypothetical protein
VWQHHNGWGQQNEDDPHNVQRSIELDSQISNAFAQRSSTVRPEHRHLFIQPIKEQLKGSLLDNTNWLEFFSLAQRKARAHRSRHRESKCHGRDPVSTPLSSYRNLLPSATSLPTQDSQVLNVLDRRECSRPLVEIGNMPGWLPPLPAPLGQEVSASSRLMRCLTRQFWSRIPPSPTFLTSALFLSLTIFFPLLGILITLFFYQRCSYLCWGSACCPSSSLGQG